MGGSELASNERIPFQAVLFSPWVVGPATSGDRVYLTDSRDGSVRVIEADGDASELVSMWRPHIPAEPVTDPLFEEYMEIYAAAFARSPEGEDYLLGVTTDELSVQYIRMYTLEKPDA